MSLTIDLQRISDLFDDWCAGRSVPDHETWFGFQRDLRRAVRKAALIEIGIDSSLIDMLADMHAADAVAHAVSDPKVVPFPQHRTRRRA